MVSSSTCNLIFRVPNVFMGGESPNHLPRWDSQFFNYLALNLSTGKIISILFTRDLDSFGIFPGSVLLLGNLWGLCLCLELQISNELLICCGITANAWFLLLVCPIFVYTFKWGCSVVMAYCLVLFFSFRRRLNSELWEEVPYSSHTTPFSSFVSKGCRESWSSWSSGRGQILLYLMHLG